MSTASLERVLLAHPCGDRVEATLFGGQVLSWVASGAEQLFLSERAVMDGSAPIRGGVPVCFPQFNQRGPLPKHGFARTQVWRLLHAPHLQDDGAVAMCLALNDDAHSRKLWPFRFELRLTVSLSPSALRLALAVENLDTVAWPFTAALHSYFRVHAFERLRLRGLGGRPVWDAVRDVRGIAADDLAFEAAFDRVFTAPQASMTLCDAPHDRLIRHDEGFSEVVVWNPHEALCAQLPDMAPQAHRHMLCVEAAKIDEPVQLAPGAVWASAQHIRLNPHGVPTA